MRTHTHTHTWQQRVLDAEHGRPAEAVVHGLHDLLFGDVGAAVLDADGRLQVVEVAAVQLEELDQQHAQVLVGVACVDARVQLRMREVFTFLFRFWTLYCTDSAF